MRRGDASTYFDHLFKLSVLFVFFGNDSPKPPIVRRSRGKCGADHSHYCAPDRAAEYCDDRVCLCVFVCPRSYLRNYTSDLHQFFVHGSVRGLVLFWWRTDTICTSGFMDDVIFAHKPRLLDVATSLSAVHTQPWAWL